MFTPFKEEADSLVTGWSWSDTLKLCTMTLPHSRMTATPVHAHLRVTFMQEYCACTTHVCSNRQTLCHKKDRVVKSDDLPYLTCKRLVHHRQLDKSNSDNTCPGSGAWEATSTYNSLTLVEVTTPNADKIRTYLGTRQTHHPLLVKTTTSEIR